MALDAGALVSVAEVQLWGATQSNSLIEAAINDASSRISRYCSRAFSSASQTETIPGTGSRYLYLKRYPVTAVASVEIDGVAVTDFSIAGDDSDCLYRANGWPVNVEAWADLTGDPDPDRTIPSIVVTYTGGYTTIPSDLKKVCIDECLLAMSAPPDPRLQEEQTAGGWRRKWATGGTDAIISAKSKAALAGYRRIIYA